MDEESITHLAQHIEQEIIASQESIQRLRSQIKPVAPDNAIGRLTRMEAMQENKMLEANLRSAEDRVIKLKAAKRRLENDPDFGICFNCGEDIPLKRLMLVPESLHCVNCALC